MRKGKHHQAFYDPIVDRSFPFTINHQINHYHHEDRYKNDSCRFLRYDFQKYGPFFDFNLVLFHLILPVRGKIGRCVKLEMPSRSTWKPMYFNSNIFLKFSQRELRRHIRIRRAIGCRVYRKIGVHLVQQQ